jgi:pimeloyl-ACP methyl ester carboxylesterase
VVALAAVTDLAAALEAKVCGDAIGQLTGGTPAQQRERYAAVSPIELVPLGVPQRLVNGSADPIVPLSQGERYVAAATRAGDEASLIVLEGAGHFEMVASHTKEWQAVKAAILEVLGARH